MKLSKTSTALILIIVIGVFATLALQFGLFIVHYDTIEMDLIVGNKVGFNTDTDALHFGTTYQGSESRRELMINNKYEFPVIISIRNTGNISSWIMTDKQTFELGGLENNTVYYIAAPPKNAPFGTYGGATIVTVKRKLW